MNHELLLPGHLITMYVKEKMEETLLAVRLLVNRDYRMDKNKFMSESRKVQYYQKHFDRSGGKLGGKIGTFLSTGNIISSTGLDLMQACIYMYIYTCIYMLFVCCYFLLVPFWLVCIHSVETPSV
jgi:DNA-directed RNA polymerase I subunit RPA2